MSLCVIQRVLDLSLKTTGLILAVPLMSCVTLGNSLHPSDSQFLIWKMNSLDQVISVNLFQFSYLVPRSRMSTWCGNTVKCNKTACKTWNTTVLRINQPIMISWVSFDRVDKSLGGTWYLGEVSYRTRRRKSLWCSLHPPPSFQERSWVIIVYRVTNWVRKKTEIYRYTNWINPNCYYISYTKNVIEQSKMSSDSRIHEEEMKDIKVFNLPYTCVFVFMSEPFYLRKM